MTTRVTPEDAAAFLPFPEPSANKYSRGKLYIVAGSATYPGAALLCARAAQKMGAGYVELYCHPDVVLALQVAQPSLVVKPWTFFDGSRICADEKPCAVVVGPGFDGQDPQRTICLRALSAQAPVLLDAGAFTFVPDFRNRMVERSSESRATVLTPHAGEAAKLFSGAAAIAAAASATTAAAAATAAATTSDAAAVTFAALSAHEQASSLACIYSSQVVLKGPHSFIANAANEDVFEIANGGPELAKAGSGDVLAGMIGALLAQGIDSANACKVGAYVHAFAGHLAAQTLTTIAVTPEDVIARIPDALFALSKRDFSSVE